jgi:hypothetical protein
MQIWKKDVLSVLAIIFVTAIFFFRFFYPVPQLLVTPDFGSSDAWHAMYPMKYALSEALQHGRLPLWNKFMGDGYPLLAEGQTGTFYLPNIVLFFLFETVTAYNLSLAIAVLTLGLGIYALLRVLGLSPIAGIFAALTFEFSGISMTHLTHMTLLQGMSLMPILLTLTHLLITRGPFPWIYIWALVLSQQIFTGFPQGTFFTILLCGSYILWQAIVKKSWKLIGSFALAITLGMVGGSAQLLPSFEFLRESQFPGGFDAGVSSYFSMPLKHLITFLSPYALGNPKLATYPHFIIFDGSVFWENNAYMGLLPIGLLAIALFLYKKIPHATAWITLGLVALLLAWGAHSPLYFLFALWPFTLFRVPSRFLWMVALSLIVLASYAFDHLWQKKKHTSLQLGIGILLVLHTVQLFGTWWSYHLIRPAYEWTAPPLSSMELEPGRIYTIGASTAYARVFNAQGWNDDTPYRFMEKGYTPDANILWDIPSHGAKAGRYILRPTLMDQFLASGITIGQTHATVSAVSQKLFDIFSVRTIFSFYPLTQEGWKIINEERAASQTLLTYTNPTALPRAYLVNHATSAGTLTQATSIISSEEFNPSQTVLLENHELQTHPEFTNFVNSGPSAQLPHVEWVTDEHETLTLKVKGLSDDAILVLTDTHYPGWIATVDEDKTPILTANLSQRAIKLPKGDHTITMTYKPMSVQKGIQITVGTYILIIGLMAVRLFSSTRYTRPQAPLPSTRRPHNHGT